MIGFGSLFDIRNFLLHANLRIAILAGLIGNLQGRHRMLSAIDPNHPRAFCFFRFSARNQILMRTHTMAYRTISAAIIGMRFRSDRIGIFERAPINLLVSASRALSEIIGSIDYIMSPAVVISVICNRLCLNGLFVQSLMRTTHMADAALAILPIVSALHPADLTGISLTPFLVVVPYMIANLPANRTYAIFVGFMPAVHIAYAAMAILPIMGTLMSASYAGILIRIRLIVIILMGLLLFYFVAFYGSRKILVTDRAYCNIITLASSIMILIVICDFFIAWIPIRNPAFIILLLMCTGVLVLAKIANTVFVIIMSFHRCFDCGFNVFRGQGFPTSTTNNRNRTRSGSLHYMMNIITRYFFVGILNIPVVIEFISCLSIFMRTLIAASAAIAIFIIGMDADMHIIFINSFK